MNLNQKIQSFLNKHKSKKKVVICNCPSVYADYIVGYKQFDYACY